MDRCHDCRMHLDFPGYPVYISHRTGCAVALRFGETASDRHTSCHVSECAARVYRKTSFPEKPTPRKEKARRPVAILLTLILVLGILISIAVLVIPELLGAVSIVFSSITGGLDQLAAFESSADFAAFPFAEQLKSLDIDWLTIETPGSLKSWIG